jgi:hypothetical protein
VDAKPARILWTLTTHNVGVGVHGPRGQVVVEGEMGPPRLVDDERLPRRWQASTMAAKSAQVPYGFGLPTRAATASGFRCTSDRNVSSSSTARVSGSAPRPWRWPGGVKVAAVLLVIGGQGIEQRGLAVVQADVVTAEAPV